MYACSRTKVGNWLFGCGDALVGGGGGHVSGRRRTRRSGRASFSRGCNPLRRQWSDPLSSFCNKNICSLAPCPNGHPHTLWVSEISTYLMNWGSLFSYQGASSSLRVRCNWKVGGRCWSPRSWPISLEAAGADPWKWRIMRAPRSPHGSVSAIPTMSDAMWTRSEGGRRTWDV